jgi:peptidoglycan hydrolase-like protein with peptidoglycan-binding domain
MPLTISTALSLGAQGDDVARVQLAIQALGRNLPPGETADRVLGPGTVAVLKAVQEELGLPATGVADVATMKAIGDRIVRSSTDPRIVRGTVVDATGAPFTKGFVQIFRQAADGEHVAGKSPLDADGSFQISYLTEPDGPGPINLRLALLSPAGAPIETTPSSASILTNAGSLEVVNFVLAGKASQPGSEHDLVLGAIRPLAAGQDVASLTEDETRHDISLSANRTGYTVDQVSALVIARRFEKQTDTPAAVFYGLIRQGLPPDLDALQAAHADVRRRALLDAVQRGIVPAEVQGKKIEDFAGTIAPADEAPLRDLLGGMLTSADLHTFATQYQRQGGNADAFWTQLAADPAWAARVPALKFTVQLGALTNNHAPLVNAIRARPDISQPADLVKLTDAQWQALVRTQGIGVPADTPGATPDERVATYAREIVTQVEAAFPTAFFAERLGASPVAAFLKSQPSFDLKTTYAAGFLNGLPGAQSLDGDGRRQLQTYQRLYRLTGRASDTTTLAERGLRSARQIASVDRGAFARQHADVFTAERANQIYDRAARTSAQALALLGEHAAGLNRTGLQALPRLDLQRQADLAAAAIPDWTTLFGAFDVCACQECESVHGPSAYFVDALRFLGERGARSVLFDRRPDLGDVELSCENTNTLVPAIDLANEVLENTVAPPVAFTPSTLADALEPDLDQTVATAALTAAFNPPLQPGTRVEAIEPGTRWRIWDEPYAYTIVKTNGVLKITARSRQTTGGADERRATPQYRNAAAYAALAQSVYPWSLPFDLASAEAKTFLTHLGVARADLIDALNPPSDPFDPNAPLSALLAAERLGLTETERRILVDEPLTPAHAPEDFWGSATVDTLSTVQELLDRSGLSYADAETVIATWFVNPTGNVAIVAKPGAPIGTCDTTKLRVDNLTAEVASRVHRFVRLWRRIGWTIADLDRTLRAFASSDAPTLTNTVLVRVAHVYALSSQLRLPVARTLALWLNIDTRDPGSLYRALFYNPAVFKPQDEDFRLQADRRELAHTEKLVTDHAAAVQAALRLTADDLALLVAKIDGHLTLANLSLLFRHATLARQLRLSVQDLLTAIDLTGLDPFRADRTEDTLRLLDAVAAVRRSGFSFPQLAYLVRHRFNPPAPFVPTDESLAQTLTEVRSALAKIDAVPSGDPVALQRSAIIEPVAAALGLPADVTGTLLDRIVHGTDAAVPVLARLADITTDPLTRSNAAAPFETLEKLLKVAAIVRTVGLPASQLAWLFREHAWLTRAPDPPATPIAFADWFSIVQLQLLRQDVPLEDAALDAVLTALTAVATATGEPNRRAAKSGLIGTLAQWLGWAPQDLETLVGKADDLADRGVLNATLPDDYRRVALVAQLQRAMVLLKRLGATAAQARGWCEATVGDAAAKAIRGAAKAKYDDDAWRTLAAPLQDALRDRQRAALVAHLVQRPSTWTTLATATVEDLYASLLVDVEMGSCQVTSRMKQAIGSVQLFAQRCLLGLEPAVDTSDAKWAQWKWMKNFRVWEAGRKIWLYPENWIEPDLRDDKTPFFEDLENELLQSDLDDAAAERAVRHYLEKLDEVARLDILGAYEDDETGSLHVFGRTFHAPYSYFYRARDGATRTWTPWSRVELDIEGDHLIPVVWNRKLMVIWPIFNDKAADKPVEMPQPGQQLTNADHYWELQLAWSTYQSGRWAAKHVSAAIPLVAFDGDDNVLFGARSAAHANAGLLARMNTGGGPGGTDPQDPHDVHDPVIDPGPGDGGTPARPRQQAPTSVFSFKALVFDDTLVVRGFLRRDYRSTPSALDPQVACPFGEFRFFGCRNIITTAHLSQLHDRRFALAPAGTRFDRMWLAQTDPAFVMADGQFPAGFEPSDRSILGDVNEPGSIAGDPAPTLANRFAIPVLDQTPWTFRLLVPHQDPIFVGDRPFFYMDDRRAFLVTSTGTSGKRNRFDDWIHADLATTWRSDYFPQPAPTPQPAPAPTSTAALTILARGARGGRVARQQAVINMSPRVTPRTALSVFWTTREYRFANFHHAYVCDIIKALDRQGLKGALSLATQSAADPASFDAYHPEPRVLQPHPIDEVAFGAGGSYDVYNWELFFHVPLLVAARLTQNQRFADAQRWYHFVFDPTGASGGTVPQRYWQTKPFHDRLNGDYEAESVQALEQAIASGPSDDLKAAVDAWRANPFSPHAVARLRTTAYQKTVVMKYLDNLIAWGDQLFRGETIESINEATELYVLAAEILGKRPDVIARKVKPPVATFNALEPELGSLGNALEQIELLVGADDADAPVGASDDAPDLPSSTVLYFGVPENQQLVAYWDLVADRLFKIRHCMNIEGQVRQLPLFEPPIDPALLVRARAAGMSIADVLSDLSVPLPNHRFVVMLQKANELVAEVKGLGAALLSALDKRDAEAFAALRAGQELRVLQTMRDVRAKQIDEAKANVTALQRARDAAQARKTYYESRDKVSGAEIVSLALLTASAVPIAASAQMRVLAGLIQKLPTLKLGSPTTAGVEVGGYYIGVSLEEAAIALDAAASILNISSQVTGRLAEYDRRQDDWNHQADLATIELKQIDQQLAAAQIRQASAEQELRSHDQQIDNARDADDFLRTKFTNQDFCQRMVGQIAGVYFRSYQLAYDLAKRAERCLQHELGLEYGGTNIIRFGYWDSLRKGLLAGEQLSLDLKRLDVAYLDGNVREYELTKHVSLASLAPGQLLALKESGSCEFDVPEWLFDLDGPGHYRRRLKMVSLTIPSVTGPYTTVQCKAQLLKSSYRRTADLAAGYQRRAPDDPSGPDDRFVDDRKILESIVTTTGQNDPGLFEAPSRDERYLPFEGAGAISRWRLELPAQFRTFDYNTISDVILHLRYTARDGGVPLRDAAVGTVASLLSDAAAKPLVRFFSLRHEFPSEWHRFAATPAAAINTLTVDLAAARFPYLAQSRTITIASAEVLVRTATGTPASAGLAPGTAAPDVSHDTWIGETAPGRWTIGTNAAPGDISDVFVILGYGIG